jgi:NAD(P)H-nitrite reductase large subunit
MQQYVIIGNGIAGISAAEAIRSLDSEGLISIIASEEFPPYSRPMISMVLEGSIGHERLPIRPQSFYEDLKIEALVGHRAVSIDVDQKQVATDRGQRLRYDHLLIASGADPRPIKAEGMDLANISYFRTETQALSLIQCLPQIKSALVLGGGLVGFKAAYGLLRRGIKVTMLIRSGYPLSMQLDSTAGEMVLDELLANGLEVKVGVEATGFEGNGRVQKAYLSDGSSLPCELVVVGKGVSPALGFVPRDRIKVDLGIVVDDHLQTTADGVFAAGDVAQALDVVRKETWVNAIWPVAAEQGRVAGANMAGRPVSFRGSVGRNVLRVFGLDVLSGGIVNPASQDGYDTLVRFDPARRLYRKLVLRGGNLVGLAMVGAIEQGGVFISLIQRQVPLAIDPELLLEPSFNFATLQSCL